MEGCLGPNVEAKQEVDLGSGQEAGVEGSLEADLGARLEGNLGPSVEANLEACLDLRVVPIAGSSRASPPRDRIPRLGPEGQCCLGVGHRWLHQGSVQTQ